MRRWLGGLKILKGKVSNDDDDDNDDVTIMKMTTTTMMMILMMMMKMMMMMMMMMMMIDALLMVMMYVALVMLMNLAMEAEESLAVLLLLVVWFSVPFQLSARFPLCLPHLMFLCFVVKVNARLKDLLLFWRMPTPCLALIQLILIRLLLS